MVSDDLELISPFAGEAEIVEGACTHPTVILFIRQTVQITCRMAITILGY